MTALKRRDLLRQALLASAAVSLGGWSMRASTQPRFSLGVASGYPTADGVVLWTRLATDPLAPDGGMSPAAVPVTWEVSADEQFRRIARRGIAYAEPEWAHSVHVEVQGLEPARDYWYRFSAGEARSRIGRTRTAPATGAALQRLRIALASCQQYEHGYYVAYRSIVADDPDLIVHVGDYIYELTWGKDLVRHHGAGECYTLADYRARHALYRGDPDRPPPTRRVPGSSPGTITKSTTTMRPIPRRRRTIPSSSARAAPLPTGRTTSTCRCRDAQRPRARRCGFTTPARSATSSACIFSMNVNIAVRRRARGRGGRTPSARMPKSVRRSSMRAARCWVSGRRPGSAHA
jgi:hypothetical protein